MAFSVLRNGFALFVWSGHSCLLSAALGFDFAFSFDLDWLIGWPSNTQKINTNPKVKGSGQECELHTGFALPTTMDSPRVSSQGWPALGFGGCTLASPRRFHWSAAHGQTIRLATLGRSCQAVCLHFLPTLPLISFRIAEIS
jgi:hypothetical protein